MAAWLPAIIGLALLQKSPPAYVVFIACTFPMQGFFNALVYFRPKYISQRQQMVPGSTERASRLNSMLNTLHLPRVSSRNLLILSRMPSSSRDIVAVSADYVDGTEREGNDKEEGTRTIDNSKNILKISSGGNLSALSLKSSDQGSCSDTMLVNAEHNNETGSDASGFGCSDLRRIKVNSNRSLSRLAVTLPVIEENC